MSSFFKKIIENWVFIQTPSLEMHIVILNRHIRAMHKTKGGMFQCTDTEQDVGTLVDMDMEHQ